VLTPTTRETNNGLEELHRPTCNHIATAGRRERPHVRTFIDGSLHVTDGRGNGVSGASGSKHQSDAFDHDQGRRPDFQGLASEACSFNRLSARLAAQFQKLPRGMRTPHANAGLPAAIKVGRLRFTSFASSSIAAASELQQR
jgi:hypothetical protein